MFIALEGVDFVGKTTFLVMVAEEFRKRGYDVLTTREPGGSPDAERIRELLLSHPEGYQADTELLLMMAARLDHLNNTIIPALEAGKIVLCDRYIHSSYVYQVVNRNASMTLYERLKAHMDSLATPDNTTLLETDFEVIKKRIKDRQNDVIEMRFTDKTLIEAMVSYRDCVPLHDTLTLPDGHNKASKVAMRWVSDIEKRYNLTPLYSRSSNTLTKFKKIFT